MTIPAYQPIDLILGSNQGVSIPPRKGFAICCPTNGATLIEDDTDLEPQLAQIKAKSNYPDSISVFPAWIHYQQAVPVTESGVATMHVSNRKFWTPR